MTDTKDENPDAVAAKSLDEESDHRAETLHSVFGTTYSLFMLICVLVNIGLLLVSHTGVNIGIYSSLDLGSEEEGTEPPISGACSERDNQIWEGINATIPDERCTFWNSVESFVSKRACPYSTETALKRAINDISNVVGIGGGSLTSELVSGWDLSSTCAACFERQAPCVTSNCLLQAFQVLNLGAAGCSVDGATGEYYPEVTNLLNCIEENRCQDLMTDCTGFVSIPEPEYIYKNCPITEDRILIAQSVSAVERELQDIAIGDECVNVIEEEIQLDLIFEITFGNAIIEALEGEAYLIAIIILVASGVWPYIKNIIMMYTWFVPLTSARRNSLLVWLGRLGRWSLVDVFAVILIIVGLRIDKNVGEDVLIIRSKSDVAIYCFVLAALFALLQGEYIRYLDRQYRRPSKDLSGALPRSALKKDTRDLLLMCLVSSTVITIGAAVAAFFSVTIKFAFGGFIGLSSGPVSFDYTTLSMPLSLIDDCQLENPGEIVLIITFILTVIVCPILSMLGYTIFGILPGAVMSKHRGFLRVVHVTANFACLDVFALSLVVVIVQFKKLVEGTISTNIEGCVGADGEFCLTFEGTLENGAYLMVTAAIFFWLAQIFSIYVQKYWQYRALDE